MKELRQNKCLSCQRKIFIQLFHKARNIFSSGRDSLLGRWATIRNENHYTERGNSIISNNTLAFINYRPIHKKEKSPSTRRGSTTTAVLRKCFLKKCFEMINRMMTK